MPLQSATDLKLPRSFKVIGGGTVVLVYELKVTLSPDDGLDYLLWPHQRGFAGTYASSIHAARGLADSRQLAVRSSALSQSAHGLHPAAAGQ
jgi:hypothetical protein